MENTNDKNEFFNKYFQKHYVVGDLVVQTYKETWYIVKNE